jgi:hypothetical protein
MGGRKYNKEINLFPSNICCKYGIKRKPIYMWSPCLPQHLASVCECVGTERDQKEKEMLNFKFHSQHKSAKEQTYLNGAAESLCASF